MKVTGSVDSDEVSSLAERSAGRLSELSQPTEDLVVGVEKFMKANVWLITTKVKVVPWPYTGICVRLLRPLPLQGKWGMGRGERYMLRRMGIEPDALTAFGFGCRCSLTPQKPLPVVVQVMSPAFVIV